MQKIGFIIVSLVLSSCATPPKDIAPPVVMDTWVANINVDEFTDKKTCTISLKDVGTEDAFALIHRQYVPYVEVVEGDLHVGIKSDDSKSPFAVGDVQLRIDKNPMWNINTSETPLGDYDTSELRDFEIGMEGMPEESLAMARSIRKKALESIMRSESTFTATSGNKALSIVRQMYLGDKLRFRVPRGGNSEMFSSVHALGASFKVAADKCNIKL